MKPLCTVMLFDEPICRAVIDSLITERVQQSYGRFAECLLPELVFDRLPIWTWTGQVRIELRRPRRSQDDRRVGPITLLKKLFQWLFPSTMDLGQHMESYLGEGVRLPLPQVIRRSDRKAHEAQTTSSDSGGDDD